MLKLNLPKVIANILVKYMDEHQIFESVNDSMSKLDLSNKQLFLSIKMNWGNGKQKNKAGLQPK